MVLYVIKNHVHLHKLYSFDFLGLDNVYFLNYFANQLIRWVVFKPFKTLAVRSLSDVKHSSCILVFYIW
jgi:hypothetical protein